MLFDITSNSDDISNVKCSPDISILSNLAIVTKYYLETIEIVKIKVLNLLDVKDKSAEWLQASFIIWNQ